MIFGTLIYGSVKKVDRTSVATSFTMLMGFPLFPLDSLYYAGHGETKFHGIPFVFSGTSTAIRGLPLASIDKHSVQMAYARAASLTFAVVAAVVFLVSFAPDKQGRFGLPTPTQTLIERYVGLTAFFLCASGGILTYVYRPQASQRDWAIRHACGQLLGIAADPALVTYHVAQAIRNAIIQMAMPAGPEKNQERIDVLRQLIDVRAQLGLGNPREPLEARTDELLAQYSAISPVAGTLRVEPLT